MADNAKRIDAIDIFRVIAAVFVIGIHSKISDTMPTMAKNFMDMVFSLAVPFFFITSGYFMSTPKNYGGVQLEENKRLHNHLKSTIQLYFIWNLIYLPLSIGGEIIYKNSFTKACFKLVRGWFLVGQNYYSWAFWYLLALIVAEIMILMLREVKVSLKMQMVASAFLFVIGVLLNYLHNYIGIRNIIIDAYYGLFMTTRNGIFVGFFYVSIGMLVKKINIPSLKCSSAIFVMTVLLSIFYPSDGALETILTAVASINLFLIIITVKVPNIKSAKHFRDLATTVYLIHMVFIFIGNEIFKMHNQLVLFAMVTICSTVLAEIILKIQWNNKKLSKVLHIN